MKRTNKHSWEKQEGTGKLKHKKCKACNCEQYFDSAYGKVIFMTNRGYVYLTTPACTPI